MFQKITEGTITIEAPVEEKISKELSVFYNPAMKLNRDLSILLLKAVDDTDMAVCDPLAGTGIRAIRFLAEIPEKKIESITINDYSADAADLIGKNIEANKKNIVSDAEIRITNKDASLMMLESKGFDYIDIDPFGTPDPFLDSAVIRLARKGILAVTATDTSSLAGTFPNVCKRRYWATPDHGHLKHEAGIRILIRKVQLIAAQYEKALVPIFSYSKEHYMRIFFRCEKGKSKADKVIAKHGMHGSSGPMWLGRLWDEKLVEKMYSLVPEIGYEFDARFLQTILDESKIDGVGFHDMHVLCKKNKLIIPKFEHIIEEIKKKGHDVSRTHFSEVGLRSGIDEKELVEILKRISKKKKS